MPATMAAKTDAEKLQDLIDSIRYKLIVHNGEWDDLPPELRSALLDELAHRKITLRSRNDPICTASNADAGELTSSGEIRLCPNLLNEAVLLHELVHAAGGQELDSEAVENHIYKTQDSDPTPDDFPKFLKENPCGYMDGKAMLLVSRFVIWDPKSGKLWFQVGSRRSPKKGKELSENINAPAEIKKMFRDNPPPECAREQAKKCGAPCKDFDQYGYCDRKVFQPPCYQHRSAV